MGKFLRDRGISYSSFSQQVGRNFRFLKEETSGLTPQLTRVLEKAYQMGCQQAIGNRGNSKQLFTALVNTEDLTLKVFRSHRILPKAVKRNLTRNKAVKEYTQKATGANSCPRLMRIINEKSQYYGQEVEPLKELSYGDKIVIQVKLENGKTEIFDREDLE